MCLNNLKAAVLNVLTSVLEGGGWSMSHTGQFSPRETPVPIVLEAGWAPQSVWPGAENLDAQQYLIAGPSSL